jgi:hypothetical protein
MQHLDRQLQVFRSELEQLVGLTGDESTKVATLCAADVRFLPVQVKDEIRSASLVPIQARLDELAAFQAWNDIALASAPHPAVTRAQVVVQNYICFVYLKDACFGVLASHAAASSVASRCAAFLSTGSVRDFRNAFSHANWCYKPDFSGLECWVLADPRNKSGAIRHFEVSQHELNFWQALSRGVAYAVYEQLRANNSFNRKPLRGSG